ncbi:MAG: fructoselysine 6-phosphate deglycase [Solirubrobacteraceae bacterium]|nr:fructoselysine 6-phosphate deglycase [Solirubrobacteraceae bacterium]
MQELPTYVEQAKESLYFSGAKIDEHLRAFLGDQGENCIELGRQSAGRIGHLYLVGSGGSLATMQTAKYILDSVLEVPVDAVPSYELVWRKPLRMRKDSLVVLASYSGETEDTVAALRAANEHGARTVAIVAKPDSTMAREAHLVVPYDSGAIYEVPIAALVRMAAGLAAGTSTEGDVAALNTGLDALPEILRRTLDAEEFRAEERARELLRDQHLYVLGAGPLSPLAYKVAMSVVMENIRIGATFSDAVEWRHGPAEALERVRGSFIVLLGTDASRELTLRTIDFCRANDSRVMVYDAAQFGDVHPLLTPVVMNSHTQWLIVYSAILRGITDLDERVFMGHNVLAAGGAQWP